MWQYEKPDNLVSWWEESVKKYGKNTLFWVKNTKGTLDSITYNEIGKRIDNARGGLAQLGIEKDDSVGIISTNRPEWVVLAYATYGRGARYIPMYEKELVQTWKYIITDSLVKVLIVSNQKIYEKVKHFIQEIPSLKRILIIDAEGEDSLKALEKAGQENPVAPVHPDAEDVAILIYTSGTTGDPKGVLLSHGNCTYCSRAGYRIYPDLNETQIGLSMLPWAHSYALSGELNNWIQFGGSLGFMEDVSTLLDDLKLVRPTYLISVPRVFNKIYDAIQNKMKETGGAKKKLFDAACATAKKKIALAQDGKSSFSVNLKFFFLDRLVFSKIRAGFGGRLTGALTASAVMNKEVGEFFYSIGIPTYDCYGLSETSPAVTMNAPDAWKIGSVGKVLEGQRIVLDKSVVEDGADDGEIVVYGPNVMKGYHNKPAETAQVMTPDGGFRTGDRGRFDAEGFLYITGRIKEQYKLENGKYVFPASIEEDIRLLPFVANAMVYGEGKAYNVCIVIPDFEMLGKWAVQNNLPADPEQLIKNKTVTDMIEKEITDQLKGKYGGYEIPKKYVFMTSDFTLENGMLTQTMKLKRHVVVKEYKDQIASLYK
ncbi:MAG: long-chain fatty acid--CoA ligase [Spirochaetae bacterium HGW-Spirochaetae-1]|nr:MAG: long-chain fatty acid--CoA ligase [Spirochaetae bacterium HGW-Spirochaetae-1]